jgi:hypothetical protein
MGLSRKKANQAMVSRKSQSTRLIAPSSPTRWKVRAMEVFPKQDLELVSMDLQLQVPPCWTARSDE